MAFQSEANLSCPVCQDIFHDPVLLSCSHSFCKACWQKWWIENRAHECPVCRRRSLQSDPPQNLALKNLCELFLKKEAEIAERASAGAEPRCSLHSKKLKLFCLDHHQPVCVICLHSETHSNHSIRPIDEAGRCYKDELRGLLKPLQEKLELLNDVKKNFDQATRDVRVQAQDTERQIKDVFSMLQLFLRKEENIRIAALKETEKQKSQMLKKTIEALDKEMSALSGTIKATEELLRAGDLCFLQNYKTVAERVQKPLPAVPEPIPGALLDMSKHLNNLPFAVLEEMKERVTSSSEVPQTKTETEPLWYRPRDQRPPDYNVGFQPPVSRKRLSFAPPMRSEASGHNLCDYETNFPPLAAPSISDNDRGLNVGLQNLKIKTPTKCSEANKPKRKQKKGKNKVSIVW